MIVGYRVGDRLYRPEDVVVVHDGVGGLGRVEQAVRRDLAGPLLAAQDSALAEVALVQAVVIDELRDSSEVTAAVRMALLKAAADLRVTLGEIRKVAAGDGDGGEDSAGLSTPVWSGGAVVRDAEVPGAADVGAEGGGDRPAAG